MSSVRMEVQRRYALSLPGELLGAALLVTGEPVVVCAGGAPGVVIAAPFGHPRSGSSAPLRAGALVQLRGEGPVFVAPNHELGELLVMVGGDEPSIFGVDCGQARPLWRLLMEGPPVGPPLLWRGLTLVADPPGALTALDLAGRERWICDLGSAPSTGPAAVDGERAVIGAADGGLHLVDGVGGRLGGWSMGGRIEALCVGPRGRVVGCGGGLMSAFEVGRREPLWSAPAEGVVSMAADPRGNLTAALADGGVIRVEAGGQARRSVLQGDRIRGLELTTSGAVVGIRRPAEGSAGLVAWPLPSPPAGWQVGAEGRPLSGEPVAAVHGSHFTSVFCRGGEVFEVTIQS